MSKIINFEDHSKKNKFEEQIVSVFSEKNKFYEFLQDGSDGVAFLHHNQYFYIFFSYVPEGITTNLPTLDESFEGMSSSVKVSQGDWYVERILAVKKEIGLKTLPLIYSKDKKIGWLRSFKQQLIRNSKKGERTG